MLGRSDADDKGSSKEVVKRLSWFRFADESTWMSRANDNDG